jgi:hypothetical protein
MAGATFIPGNRKINAPVAGELSECAAYFIVVPEFVEHRSGKAGVQRRS